MENGNCGRICRSFTEMDPRGLNVGGGYRPPPGVAATGIIPGGSLFSLYEQAEVRVSLMISRSLGFPSGGEPFFNYRISPVSEFFQNGVVLP